MGRFILRRGGMIVLTALCLTFVVFFLTNLPPNLEKLAKTEASARMSDDQVVSWLGNRGYLDPMPLNYARWLGLAPAFERHEDGMLVYSGCLPHGGDLSEAPRFCGVLQGDWGY